MQIVLKIFTRYKVHTDVPKLSYKQRIGVGIHLQMLSSHAFNPCPKRIITMVWEHMPEHEREVFMNMIGDVQNCTQSEGVLSRVI